VPEPTRSRALAWRRSAAPSCWQPKLRATLYIRRPLTIDGARCVGGRRQRPGRATVVVTDDLRSVEDVAHVKAILSHGRLKCLGTSHDIMQRFRLGYTLHLSPAEEGKGQVLPRKAEF
jgi:hypothetical protein